MGAYAGSRFLLKPRRPNVHNPASKPTGFSRYRATTTTTVVHIVTGTAETIIPSLNLVTPSIKPGASVSLSWLVWVSQWNSGVGKQMTLRLRRTGLSGTVLASTVFGDIVDSTGGHVSTWNSSYTDSSPPADGGYVITAQATQGNASGHLWSDTRTFTAISTVTPYSPVATEINGVGNVLVVTGTTETLLNGCDLTLASSVVELSWNLWVSQWNSGQVKQITIRLRRTNITGAILATQLVGDISDNTGGHMANHSGIYQDSAVTDGRYVITVQATGGDGSSQIWSDTRSFALTGRGLALSTPIPLRITTKLQAPQGASRW